jgi:hypothetical protein
LLPCDQPQRAWRSKTISATKGGANNQTSWTCAYCEVEVRWVGAHDNRGLPVNWSKEQEGLACLSCRRQLAADGAIDNGTTDLSVQKRAKLRSHALLEFEVTRDPSRSNAEIAGAVHTSVVAVQKARERLGLMPSTA